ncbi:MAG TPA: sodium:calcium antiporter [Chloroflexia bacterium]|nr:sodium:calcium antiporter [Chloroflexia bacterium]
MKKWSWVIIAFLVTLPGLVAVLGGFHLDKEAPVLGAVLFGVAVIGAAFLLSWACEVAQMDIPAALALSVLALIAVLPEYAVDFSLTYQAATNKEYEALAVANMIGANRMIVGFAWPLIIFLFWLRFRKKAVTLEKSQRVEIGFLGLAGLYSLIIPIKGHIDIIDVVILVGLFVLYTVRISRSEVHEPELIGPAQLLGSLSNGPRRAIVSFMLIFAGLVIFVVAHPFAESLVLTGKNIGVDEVFMVQWFAPIASEAPEIVVCILFTLRGLASAGLGALVASKVNQWTLLVGTLPLVFSLGSGYIRSLPLNGDQVGSMFVTSGQTLLAVAIMMNLSAHIWEAGLLFVLFIAQFFFPDQFLFFNIDAHYVFGVIYIVLAVAIIARIPFREHKAIISTMFNFGKRQPEEEEVPEAALSGPDKVRALEAETERVIEPARSGSKNKEGHFSL